MFLLLLLQPLTDADGRLSITFKKFTNNANTADDNEYCDDYWGSDQCDTRVYACLVNSECSTGGRDISGNHGYHSGRNLNQNQFENTNPFNADYPVSVLNSYCYCGRVQSEHLLVPRPDLTDRCIHTYTGRPNYIQIKCNLGVEDYVIIARSV